MADWDLAGAFTRGFNSGRGASMDRARLAEEMAGRRGRESQAEQAGARAGLQLDINQQEMDLRAREERRKAEEAGLMAPLARAHTEAETKLAQAMAGKAGRWVPSGIGAEGLNERGLVQREAAIRRQLASPYTPEEDRTGLQGELDSIGTRLNKLQGVQAPPADAPVTEPSAWERFSQAASGALGSAISPIRGAAQWAGQASGAVPAAAAETPRIAASMAGKKYTRTGVDSKGRRVGVNSQTGQIEVIE